MNTTTNQSIKPLFDVAAWKRETYRKLLHPGGAIPKFEHKPPIFFYGSTGGVEDTADPDVEIDFNESTDF